jgi:hypothetical protein
MRTTVDLPEDLLEKARRATDARVPTLPLAVGPARVKEGLLAQGTPPRYPPTFTSASNAGSSIDRRYCFS